jgi:hypothetical protein
MITMQVGELVPLPFKAWASQNVSTNPMSMRREGDSWSE